MSTVPLCCSFHQKVTDATKPLVRTRLVDYVSLGCRLQNAKFSAISFLSNNRDSNGSRNIKPFLNNQKIARSLPNDDVDFWIQKASMKPLSYLTFGSCVIGNPDMVYFHK